MECKDCGCKVFYSDITRCMECLYVRYYSLHRRYNEKVHLLDRNNRQFQMLAILQNIKKMKKKVRDVGANVTSSEESSIDGDEEEDRDKEADPDWNVGKLMIL